MYMRRWVDGMDMDEANGRKKKMKKDNITISSHRFHRHHVKPPFRRHSTYQHQTKNHPLNSNKNNNNEKQGRNCEKEMTKGRRSLGFQKERKKMHTQNE